MKEIWKAIPGYEGSFEVSNLGNFRSLDRMVPSRYGSPRNYPGKPLKVEEMKDGYKRIVLMKDAKKKRYMCHRLVALTFIDNPNNLPELDHLDGNRMNPSANNLEWVTHQENVRRAQEKGNYSGRYIGAKNPKAKLNDDIVKDIRKDFVNGLTQNKISKKYNIPWSTIHNIVTYQTWKHVD